MSFILLDECVAKCCVDGATIYTAQRTSTVQCPGRGADDLMIYEFARAVGCILVTQNGRDFATLCVRYGPLPVIVLPAAPPRVQHAYLRWIIPGARGFLHPRQSVLSRSMSKGARSLTAWCEG